MDRLGIRWVPRIAAYIAWRTRLFSDHVAGRGERPAAHHTRRVSKPQDISRILHGKGSGPGRNLPAIHTKNVSLNRWRFGPALASHQRPPRRLRHFKVRPR